MFGKKGADTLVLSVLLIVFIITISSVIFNWVKKTSDIGMSKGEVLSEKIQECRDFDFLVEEAYCEEDNVGVVKVKITNNKDYDLKEAFSVRLIGNEGSDVTIASILDVELKAYETKLMNIFKQQEEDIGFGISFK